VKSAIVTRSVVVGGLKASVSLEEAFWNGMKEISWLRDMTLSQLVGSIHADRQQGNLSSAIRLFVLDHIRSRAPERWRTQARCRFIERAFWPSGPVLDGRWVSQ
jgi:predicted DNA-binding ribbon-helix-helix protein